MTGRVIKRDALGSLTKLGQGGQGIVYRAPNLKTKFADAMVFKEYKPAALAAIDFTALSAMPVLVEEALPYGDGEKLISLAAWPCALVESDGGPLGFVMPTIPDQFFIPLTTVKGVASAAAEFQHLLNEPSVLAARGITIDDAQRYGLLRETASALAFLHSVGVCVGDISPKNLLFALEPREAVYFIDCDAMRINGVTALPQFETPGWEAPAGEEPATVYSDTYKLGLLALRLIVGNQNTRNVAQIPATTPNLLRQIIVDTLTNEPQRRPLPAAWTYVLGHAVEEAQHRNATDPTPALVSEPASPPVEVRKRPKATAKVRTPTPPPVPEPASAPASTLTLSKWAIAGVGVASVALGLLIAILLVMVSSGGADKSASKPRRTPTTTFHDGWTNQARPPAMTSQTSVDLAPPPLALLHRGADSYGDTSCASGKPVPGHYGRRVGRGSDVTSCIFAVNVGTAYWTHNAIASPAPTKIIAPHTGTVTCPSTGATECDGSDYIMRCGISGGDRWITCRGGRDAVVYLF